MASAFDGAWVNRNVPDASNTLERPLLHIRPDSHRGATVARSGVAALLASGTPGVDRCGDVYRALARLCRSAAGSTRTVVVCVDGMGMTELEFFTILSRVRRDITVYVYGQEQSRRQIDSAIERGAIGVATEEIIPTLCRDVLPMRRESTLPPTPSMTTIKAPVTPAGLLDDDPLGEAPEPPTPAPTYEDPTHETSEAPPVRVPWLRYDRVPIRGAPRRAASSPPAVAADSPMRESIVAPAIVRSTVRETPVEPLLTEAELEALLGDDIAAIVPPDSLGFSGGDRVDDPGSR